MITPNFAIYNAAGEILRTGRVSEDEIHKQAINPGDRIFRGEAALEDLIDTTAAKPVLVRGGKGKQPSGVHEWSGTSKAWVPDLGKTREARARAVDRERDRRVALPIVYDGKNVDADKASLEILGNKILTSEIQDRRGTPPQAGTLVWKDADNIVHSFPSIAAYRTWLEGLALAIDQRGAQVWGWSWERKVAIDAATTYEAIQAVALD